MSESDCAVVRESLADEDMPVEASHLRDGEHADAAEASGGNGKDFAFCDVGTKNAVTVALQTEEGDLTGGD